MADPAPKPEFDDPKLAAAVARLGATIAANPKKHQAEPPLPAKGVSAPALAGAGQRNTEQLPTVSAFRHDPRQNAALDGFTKIHLRVIRPGPLRVRRIGFRSLTEALDTTTAQRRLVFSNPSGSAWSSSQFRPSGHASLGPHHKLESRRTCRSMGSPTVSKTLDWRHMDQERTHATRDHPGRAD